MQEAKEIKELRRSLNLVDEEDSEENEVFDTDENIDLDDLDDAGKPYIENLMNLDDDTLEDILMDDDDTEYEVKSSGKRTKGTKIVIQKKKPKASSGDSSMELKDSLNSSQDSDLILTDDEILAIQARHLSPADKRRRSLLLQKRRQDVYIQGLRQNLGNE